MSKGFKALSHPYRRRVLIELSDHNPRDEDELSPGELVAEDEALELFTQELYHVHLPHLDDAGYIEWDREQHTVRRGPQFDEISPLIELMLEHQDELPEGWP